jgi:hypothetical protein
MSSSETPPAVTQPSTSAPAQAGPAASNQAANDFANQANTAAPSIVREFIDFLRDYRVWWLTPLIIVLVLLGGLAFLSETALAPFIYPLW